MKTVKIKAYAKVNLTLEILGMEGEYHALDSLVASVDLYDLIVLKKRKNALSFITMKGMGSESIPPEKNNALKAAELFSEAFGTLGADITVYKNIPIGAGLGGSSADVSGVLNGMAALYGIEDREKLKELADKLGSDTGYMLTGGFARMQGRGEKVTPIKTGNTLYFLLLCPESSVNTGACYRKYDELTPSEESKQRKTDECIRALVENNLDEVGRCLANDLYLPACRVNNEVQKTYEEALAFSPLGAVMTGSGSGVLALFSHKELCEWAKSRYKGKAKAYVLQTVVPDYKQTKKGGGAQWSNPFVLRDEEKQLLD